MPRKRRSTWFAVRAQRRFWWCAPAFPRCCSLPTGNPFGKAPPGPWWRPGIPRGERLALGRDDGSVQVLSPGSAGTPITFRAPAPWVTALAWSPNGDQLAVAAGKTITWWDPSGRELGRWDQAPSTVADLHWPLLGPLAACGYGGAWVFGQPGAPPSRSLTWKGSSLKVRWSPNLKWLATADQDKTVHIWPWPQGSDLMMGSFDAKALSLVWNSSGSHLATSGSSTLLLWDCRGKGPGGRRPGVGAQQEGLITAIDLAQVYATVDDEGALTVWGPDLSVVAQADLRMPGVAVRWTSSRSLLAAGGSGKVTLFHLDGSLATP